MAPIWSYLRREPLVHFAILAALLFVADALWSGGEREVIRVDRATQEFLIQQQAELALRPLTPEEEDEVVASYVEEEILWREAYKRGLDRNARIRRRLVQDMRVFLSSDLPKPSEAELRAFYEREKHRFESPPALTLDHVFFADPEAVPEATLDGLNDGADPTALGDFDMSLGRVIRRAGQWQLAGLFGPEGARAILAIEDDAWHGPLLSPRGAHFIRVAARHPGRLPSFEEAAAWLEGEWTLAKQREVLDRELEALREGYKIVVEERGAAGDD